MTPRAHLRRAPSTDHGTLGRLQLGTAVLHTVELPWRDNRRQRSCIPPGLYRCALVRSPRFGLVYGVQDVPGRSHVLIHAANLAGDVEKGWTTQLHGCIAPCRRPGQMRLADGRWQAAGLVSAPALRELMEWASGQPFDLEIETCSSPDY